MGDKDFRGSSRECEPVLVCSFAFHCAGRVYVRRSTAVSRLEHVKSLITNFVEASWPLRNVNSASLFSDVFKGAAAQWEVRLVHSEARSGMLGRLQRARQDGARRRELEGSLSQAVACRSACSLTRLVRQEEGRFAKFSFQSLLDQL